MTGAQPAHPVSSNCSGSWPLASHEARSTPRGREDVGVFLAPGIEPGEARFEATIREVARHLGWNFEPD